jgi:glycosyltransferase involved in cell wall biosynthesis
MARAYDTSLLQSLPPEVQIRRTESLQANRVLWIVHAVFHGLRSLLRRSAATGNRSGSGFRFPPFLIKMGALMRSWILMPDDRILWLPFALVAGWRWAREARPEVILARAGPHSVNLVAYFLSRLTGLPFVVDWADPWTQRPYYDMPTPAHRWWNEYWEGRILRTATQIVVICDQMREDLNVKYPFTQGKVEVITNGYDATLFAGLTPKANREKFTISHVGTLDPPRLEALQTLCEAVEQAGIAEETVLNLVGRVDPEYDQLRQQYSFLKLVGYVSHSEAVQHLLDASVLLLCMKEIDGNVNNTITIPGKVFEYLASGTPILALGPDSDATRLITQTNSGLAVSPNDLESVRKHVLELHQQWKTGDLRMTPATEVRQFERRVLTERLAELLDEVVAERNPVRKAPKRRI